MAPLSSLGNLTSSLTDPLQRPQTVPRPLSCFETVSRKYFSFNFYLLKEMYVYVCACPTAHMGKSEESLQEGALSFHDVGLGGQNLGHQA